MTNMAIPERPICAASEQLDRRHRIVRGGYVVHDQDGQVWHLCSARCAGLWSPPLPDEHRQSRVRRARRAA